MATILTRRLIGILLSASVTCSACGGGDDKSGDPLPPRAPRLEWDQRADSLQQVRSLTFKLYVDKVGRPLSDPQCVAATAEGFYVCTAPLPQLDSSRHVLQLTSMLNGVESPLSEPLAVSTTAGGVTVTAERDSSPSESAVSCVSGSATECYRIREIATGLSGVSALSPTPDGRLFFVEGSARVRAVADGALVAQPALELRNEEARIVGLAVDAGSFPENKLMLVAWTERTRSEQLQLNVTRYREVANTLGEGSSILTGVPVPRETSTSIAVDRTGLVYVAIPALDSSAGSGVILRITRDGGVPSDNRFGTPAFTSGFSTPTSLSLDSDHRLLWLAGRNDGNTYAVGVVPVSPSESPQSARIITQVASDQPVSFVLSKAGASEQPILYVLANGRLSKALRTQDGSVAGYAVIDLGDVRLTNAVVAANGSMYVASEASVFELHPE